MSRPGAAASATLAAVVVKPAFLCWADFVGDPLFATTWPSTLTPAGTGDPELDGKTFSAIDPQFVDIGPVKQSEGGSDTVTATLSGLVGPDTDLLNLIGNTANWRGRVFRLWQGIYNAEDVQQGAFWSYHTGTMVAASIRGDPAQQLIEIKVEGYLASLTAASNRTYLDQAYYDPGDLSAEVAIAAANGPKKNISYGSAGGGGLGGLGGAGDVARRVFSQ